MKDPRKITRDELKTEFFVCRQNLIALAKTSIANFYEDYATKLNSKGRSIVQQKLVVSYRKRPAGSNGGK